MAIDPPPFSARPIIHPAADLQSSMRVNKYIFSPHRKNVLRRPRGAFSHCYLRKTHLIKKLLSTQAIFCFRRDTMTNFTP